MHYFSYSYKKIAKLNGLIESDSTLGVELKAKKQDFVNLSEKKENLNKEIESLEKSREKILEDKNKIEDINVLNNPEKFQYLLYLIYYNLRLSQYYQIFAQTAMSLNDGETSEAIVSQFGYHIIKNMEKRFLLILLIYA